MDGALKRDGRSRRQQNEWLGEVGKEIRVTWCLHHMGGVRGVTHCHKATDARYNRSPVYNHGPFIMVLDGI